MIRRKQVTLRPVGADGSAVTTLQVTLGRPGVVGALKVDYQNQPATTDLIIKADSSTGPTLFTRSNSNTDLALTPVGMPAVDETGAAVAATDGTFGGWPFLSGLYFDVAQGDGQTSGDEKIVVDVLYQV
jgi:hypothetical protein